MLLPSAPDTPPPTGRLRLRTSELDRARDHIGGVFTSHTLAFEGAARWLDFAHHEARLDGLSLNHLHYGADVVVTAPALQDFHLLQFTLAGSCEVRMAGRSLALPAGSLAVMNPSRPYAKHWRADCRQLILRLDRSALMRQLGDDRLPEFAFVALAADGAGASLARLAELMCREVAAGGAIMQPTAQRALIDALAATLLATVPHAPGRRVSVIPAPVRRAETFMAAQLATDLSLGDIATAAAVSVRSLQRDFRRFRNQSPMAVLKALRLDRVRAALLDPAAPRSVTALAAAHGLTHPGKFARAYKRRFGEAPSTTRRRAGA